MTTGEREVAFAGRGGYADFTLTGVLTGVQKETTADGRSYAHGVLTLPWNEGVVEQVPVVFPPRCYQRSADLIVSDALLYVTGRADLSGDVRTFNARKVQHGQYWWNITPLAAMKLNLHDRHDIVAPLNELGERCPWPWDPQQLAGVAMGMYHCRYCGAMCCAGLPHPTYEISASTYVTDRSAPHSPAANAPRREPTK